MAVILEVSLRKKYLWVSAKRTQGKTAYSSSRSFAGRTDSSGLRLHYRPAQPRHHDVGILTTGVKPGYVDYNIPPRAPQFHTYGTCNTTVFPQVWDASRMRDDLTNTPSVDCLCFMSQPIKPIPDLHVFAVMLHTHLAGRKVRAAHYRWETWWVFLSLVSFRLLGSSPAWLGLFSDGFVTVVLVFCRKGQQIDFFLADENYDFDFQQTVRLGSFRTIKQVCPNCFHSCISYTRVGLQCSVTYLKHLNVVCS